MSGDNQFKLHEVVRSGNSTALVKAYFPANNYIHLYNIYGVIGAGSTIVGDDSGASLTLANFTISSAEDEYVYDPWLDIEPTAIVLDDGRWVALDAHFTGETSQEYQPDYVVTL